MSVESVAPNAPPAAVEVFYGKPTEGGCKLVPAPFIDWIVDPEFNDTGVRIRNINKLTLTGSSISRRIFMFYDLIIQLSLRTP